MTRDKQLGLFLAGAGFGAAAGILFARRAEIDWRKMRKQLKVAAKTGQRKIEKVNSYARDAAHDAKEAMGSATAAAAKTTGEMIDQTRAFVRNI